MQNNYQPAGEACNLSDLLETNYSVCGVINRQISVFVSKWTFSSKKKKKAALDVAAFTAFFADG